MTAYNVVRMRVKPGREEEFLRVHKGLEGDWMQRMREHGMRRRSVIKTGERSYCVIGEWENKAAIQKAIPDMIASLDLARDLLEDLGGGLGVTDPVSGEAIIEDG